MARVKGYSPQPSTGLHASIHLHPGHSDRIVGKQEVIRLLPDCSGTIADQAGHIRLADLNEEILLACMI
jgi:hypothetical protein